MSATAAVNPEVEKQIGDAERLYSQAKDECDQLEHSLREARKRGPGSRVLDLEFQLKQKQEVLADKRTKLESAWALRGTPIKVNNENNASHLQRPGSVDSLIATNPEFRAAEMEVRRLEREVNRLTTELAPLQRMVDKFIAENPTFFVQTPRERTSADLVARALDPAGAKLEDNFQAAQVDKRGRLLRAQRELAKLNECAAKLAEATATRDAVFARLTTAPKR